MVRRSKPAVQSPPFKARRSKPAVQRPVFVIFRCMPSASTSISRRWIRLAPIESRPLGPAVAVAVAVDAVEVPGCRRGRNRSRPSTIDHQPSTINHQPSTIDHR